MKKLIYIAILTLGLYACKATDTDYNYIIKEIENKTDAVIKILHFSEQHKDITAWISIAQGVVGTLYKYVETGWQNFHIQYIAYLEYKGEWYIDLSKTMFPSQTSIL